ncbi:MAG: hypothetical protein ACLSGB_03750 [Dorea sp.]
MDIANFVVGQLVGLAEPLLVLRLIVKMSWLEEFDKTSKRMYYRLLSLFVVRGCARVMEGLPGSYVVIIAIDACIAMHIQPSVFD